MGPTLQLNVIEQQLFNPRISERIRKDYGLSANYSNSRLFAHAFLTALGQTPIPNPVAASYTNSVVFEATVRALGSNARKWSSFLANEPELRDVLFGYDPGKVVSSGVSPASLMPFLPGQTSPNDSHAIITWAHLLNAVPDYYQTVIAPVARRLEQSNSSLTTAELLLCLVGFFGTDPDLWSGNGSLIASLPQNLQSERVYSQWSYTSTSGKNPSRIIRSKKWKFPGMGYALGSEFLRNLKWDGFKVDRHIRRLFSRWVQDVDPIARKRAGELAAIFGAAIPGELKDYFCYSLLGMAISPSGVPYSHVDNLVWAPGAYAEKKGCESDIAYVRDDGASPIFVVQNCTPDSKIVSPANREASYSQASTVRESNSSPAATIREIAAGTGGSLVRLPAALAARYDVERELPTRGNEADLLGAVDRNSGEHVVIKLYRSGIEPKADVQRLIAGLDSRHVIQQLGHGSSEGRYFEVMEFANGGTIADLLRNRQRPMTEEEVIPIIKQLADALAYLHGLTPQLVHRDVKPDNVLVRQLDPLDLVLTDFGIASVVEGGSRIAGSVHRTILYAAPEAMVGDISPAMDWWSLGMMVAEAAGGCHPFLGVTDQAIAIHLSNRRPIPLGAVVEPRVRLLCQGLLAYDQRQRWGIDEISRWLGRDSTLHALGDALQSHSGTNGSEPRATRPYRIGNHECWTASELAVGMCWNWDDAVKRMARRADLERWLTNDLNDQNLLNGFLDIAEIPEITSELQLITFLQVLLPGAVTPGSDNAVLEPRVLKICLQAGAGMPEAERQLGELRISGEGLPADQAEAERLLRIAASKGDTESSERLKEIERFHETRRAAEAGQAEAQYDLAVMFNNGKGIVRDDNEAFKCLRKASEQGHLPAQAHLGYMYLSGNGVAQDYTEAINWYRIMAGNGFAEAQWTLGTMYYRGMGVTRNGAEAVRWFRMAAEQDNADAQCDLGDIYCNGKLVAQDFSEAAKWYRKAAEQGHARGQLNLAAMYFAGEGVTQDQTEAAKWFRMAAEQGHDEAQTHLGVMYSKGHGVPQDYSEAVKWYRMAAEKGNVDAQFGLGDMYNAGQGVVADISEAVRWYKMAAEQGDTESQFRLGLISETTKDPKRALKWYRMAAEQGHAGAQHGLGQMYLDGKGIPQDHEEGVHWLRMAAEQGFAEAQCLLGWVSADEHEYAEAAFWLHSAAEQGHAQAQCKLGFMNAEGQGVLRNDFEAVRWFRMAAEQGHVYGQFFLGEMYLTGRGVQESRSEAVRWLRLSAQQGYDPARRELDVLLSNPGFRAKDTKWHS